MEEGSQAAEHEVETARDAAGRDDVVAARDQERGAGARARADAAERLHQRGIVLVRVVELSSWRAETRRTFESQRETCT